jgi:hypothetical protein
MGKTNETEIVEPTEGKRMRTSFNILTTQVDALAEIAEAKNLTKTALIDEALATYLSEVNKTTKIDGMLATTNSFLFSRDLERVKELLSPDEAKKLLPPQKVYLYSKLKDVTDRQRVFEALGLITDLDEINTINMLLEKASKFKDGKLLGYNLNMLAHHIRAKLTPLQEKHLALKLGTDSIKKLKRHIIDKFPQPQIFKNMEKTSSENPTLETVLTVVQVSEKAWKTLPESIRKQVHEAVAKGQLELAKGLVTGAKTVIETAKSVAERKLG